MNIEHDKTQRGFDLIRFTDMERVNCIIQKSSFPLKDSIWLGVEDPKIVIRDKKIQGKYVEMDKPDNMVVYSSIHLTQEQVRDLLPILNHFVDTGELPSEDEL